MTPPSTHRLSFENRRPHGISTTEEYLVMKSILLGATVLMGLSVPAWATSLNEIRIDATTAGTIKTLSITQDDVNLANQVGGLTGGTTTLPVKGSWKTVSIDQQGGTNVFNGSLKATGGPANATLNASYAGGNTHSLEIGTTTAPVNPTVQIAVTNTGGGTNTITDTLDGNALSYNLTLTGTGNTVTNTVSASGAVTLNQGMTGSNNTVSNSAAGVTSFTHTLTLTGDNNSITNSASGAAAKTFTQSIGSSGNTIVMNLDSSDAQTGALTVGSGSMVDYDLHASATGASTNILLSNVLGAGGTTPAVIRVTQTSAATGASAALSVSGGIYEMGTQNSGSGTGTGVYVYQNSPGAVLNAMVTANANGYTANFVQ
jgi:hypothetical protein